MSGNEETEKRREGVYPPESDDIEARRSTVKKVLAGAGAAGVIHYWTRPIVESAVLPGHAQTTTEEPPSTETAPPPNGVPPPNGSPPPTVPPPTVPPPTVPPPTVPPPTVPPSPPPLSPDSPPSPTGGPPPP